MLIWAANLVHGGSPVTKAGSSRWSQVTHCFFDDCVHCTPMLSKEVIGDLFVRQPIDVRTAMPIRSAYLEPTADLNADKSKESTTSTSDPSDDELRIRRLTRRVERLERELQATRNTWHFRYTRRPRTLYAKLRRLTKLG